MGRYAAVMTLDEKRQVLAQKVAEAGDDAFVDAPVKESTKSKGAKGIQWEVEIGDLDAFRRNIGRGRAILPVVMAIQGETESEAVATPEEMEQALPEVDSAKTESLMRAVRNRMLKVFPGESWGTWVSDGFVYLSFNGARRKVSTDHAR